MDNVPVSTQARRYLADRYRLEEVLGRGATGTVWAAYDEVLRRRVAVKEVPPPPGMPAAEADELRERTLREARSIAVLTHPNVVTLYDVVRQDGEPFVVMELLPALSLAKVISEQGPLDTGGAALVGHAVASALQAAHDAGITHRDVKPANVLIGTGADGGRIKLTDFGIARNVAEATMTATGMTLGSPAFIAPEVASGGQVSPAADLWGLGATLFAAVQGRPPYDAGDVLATVAAVVNGEVPRPTAAGPLTPVITGLMVKDPAARMPLAEVRRLLRPLLPPDGRVLREADTTVLPVVAGAAAATGEAPAPAGSPAPGGSPAGGSGGAAGGGSARIDPSTPLAADPGPLPFTVRPFPAQPPPAPGLHPARRQHPGLRPHPGRRRGRRSPLTRIALALAAVLLFAGGAAGGFGLSRWAAGAPLLPELSTAGPATTTASPPPADPAALRVQRVSVADDRPGTRDLMVTTFTIGVPGGWSAYRPPLSDAASPIIAMFVSPDGSRTIAVDHLPGFYPKGSVTSYLARLRDSLSDAVDDVVAQPVNPVGPATRGATEGPFETSFRTVERGAGGASGELLRTTLLYLLPTATDLWVVKVTVPSDQQKSADALYSSVVGSFAPP